MGKYVILKFFYENNLTQTYVNQSQENNEVNSMFHDVNGHQWTKWFLPTLYIFIKKIF